jgi:hypothetical protein
MNFGSRSVQIEDAPIAIFIGEMMNYGTERDAVFWDKPRKHLTRFNPLYLVFNPCSDYV